MWDGPVILQGRPKAARAATLAGSKLSSTATGWLATTNRCPATQNALSDASRASPASSSTHVRMSAPCGCARCGCNCSAALTTGSSAVSDSAAGVCVESQAQRSKPNSVVFQIAALARHANILPTDCVKSGQA